MPMHPSASHSLPALYGTFFGAAIASLFGGGAAIAQDFPACPPPAEGEYLLLAIANEDDERDAAIEALDDEYPAQTCTYLDETVVRVSGFTDSTEATELARAFTNDLGLSAFVTRLPESEPEPDIEPQFEPRPYGQALELPDVQVVDARPADGSEPTAAAIEPDGEPDDAAVTEDELPVFTPEDLPPPQVAREPEPVAEPVAREPDTVPAPVVSPAPRGSGDRVPPPFGTTANAGTARTQFQDDGQIRVPFNPQPFADGFVVLVDYFNDPSVASEVAAVTGQAVGLVSYGRRPFLMADFSTSEDEAKATLESLSDAGLWPLVVDSERAILLTPRVRLAP